MSKSQSNSDLQSAVQLCAGVLPVWIRQLESSRTQSEKAVHSMLEAFGEMDPGLHQARQHAGEIPVSVGRDPQPRPELVNALKDLLLPHLKSPDESMQVAARVCQLIQDSAGAADRATTVTGTTAVDRMYMGLQYQDRIAQMMALLEQDMLRLHNEIAGDGASRTPLADWLARLESQYAMAEQRASHVGDGSVATDGSNDETTFF